MIGQVVDYVDYDDKGDWPLAAGTFCLSPSPPPLSTFVILFPFIPYSLRMCCCSYPTQMPLERARTIFPLPPLIARTTMPTFTKVYLSLGDRSRGLPTRVPSLTLSILFYPLISSCSIQLASTRRIARLCKPRPSNPPPSHPLRHP